MISMRQEEGIFLLVSSRVDGLLYHDTSNIIGFGVCKDTCLKIILYVYKKRVRYPCHHNQVLVMHVLKVIIINELSKLRYTKKS